MRLAYAPAEKATQPQDGDASQTREEGRRCMRSDEWAVQSTRWSGILRGLEDRKRLSWCRRGDSFSRLRVCAVISDSFVAV